MLRAERGATPTTHHYLDLEDSNGGTWRDVVESMYLLFYLLPICTLYLLHGIRPQLISGCITRAVLYGLMV